MPKSLRVLLPLLMIILGLLAAYVSIRSIIEAFRQNGTLIPAPGQATVSVQKPGSYTIWIQNQGTVGGKFHSYPVDLPPGAVIEVTNADSGEPIPVGSGGSATVTINSTIRKSVASVDLPQPAQLKITISQLESPRLFYFSESFSFGGLFGSIVLLGTGGFLFLAGLGLGLYFLLRPAPREYHTLQPPR